MTREEAIEKVDEAQSGMPGSYGEALRIALQDMRTMLTMSGTVQKDAKTAEDACTDGACPIRYKED